MLRAEDCAVHSQNVLVCPTGHVIAAKHDRAGLFRLCHSHARACRKLSGIHLKSGCGFPRYALVPRQPFEMILLDQLVSAREPLFCLQMLLSRAQPS